MDNGLNVFSHRQRVRHCDAQHLHGCHMLDASEERWWLYRAPLTVYVQQRYVSEVYHMQHISKNLVSQIAGDSSMNQRNMVWGASLLDGERR